MKHFTLILMAILTQPLLCSATYLQKMRSLHSRAEFEQMTGGKVRFHRSPLCSISTGETLVGSPRGVVLQFKDGRAEPFPPARLLPHSDITVIAEQTTGVYWVGTTRGAVRYEPAAPSSPVQYFASKRWLPEDRVAGIGFEGPEPAAAVWIETPSGFSRIKFKPMTLAEKARSFETRVRARHVRHGFTASSHLRIPGDLASNQPVSSDNDGLWTAMYLAAECFRYKVTGEPEGRQFAGQGLRALMRLESMTGISGFPARSFIKVSEEEQPRDGEWHATKDGRWKWKGDTSSDEIVGHYFAYAIYYDLVADEAEREEIRSVVNRITAHIVDNGFHLLDVDGKPTRWGWWAPDEIWGDPDETGLRALHLLSHLRVAHHITGNERWQRTYEELVTKHRYAELTRNQKINVPGHLNHSDDELAFLSYYPLLLYEKDPALRKTYQESLERSWQIERPERCPLWNYIYAVGSGSRAFDEAESLRTLREIPMDLVSWTIRNSDRLDVGLDLAADRFQRKQSLRVLPADERPIMKWNGNPFVLDGGDDGRSEDDGAFLLLPYWLARHHKLLSADF